jgi:hypothetical protein
MEVGLVAIRLEETLVGWLDDGILPGVVSFEGIVGLGFLWEELAFCGLEHVANIIGWLLVESELRLGDL